MGRHPPAAEACCPPRCKLRNMHVLPAMARLSIRWPLSRAAWWEPTIPGLKSRDLRAVFWPAPPSWGPSPCLKTRLRLVSPRFLSPPGRETYLLLSFPIMIGFSIVVVDEWIIKNQASYLPEGALSYLQYGRTLNCCVDRLPTVITPIGDPSRSSGTPKKGR
jgi:hypothetical protein